MKSISKHLIYIPIIAFLGFQYWSKATLLERTCASLGGINQQLEDDRTTIESSFVADLMAEIDKNAARFSKQKMQQENARAANDYYQKSIQFIETCKKELIAQCGGLDSVNNRLKNGNSNSVSKLYFNTFKINEIENYLKAFNDTILKVEDSVKMNELSKKYTISAFLKSKKLSTFSQLSNINALSSLSELQNLILENLVIYLNYQVDMSGHLYCGFSPNKTAIVPKKASLMVGEAFECDIFLTTYSTNAEILKATVNGKKITIKEGFAHFISPPNSLGTKTIKAELSLRNPATGALSISKGEFEYEVLPKCSRDCQQ